MAQYRILTFIPAPPSEEDEVIYPDIIAAYQGSNRLQKLHPENMYIMDRLLPEEEENSHDLS